MRDSAGRVITEAQQKSRRYDSALAIANRVQKKDNEYRASVKLESELVHKKALDVYDFQQSTDDEWFD